MFPLTEVNCPLYYAGCEVKLPRKDMPEHMRDTVTHLTLLATVTHTLLKENQELKQQLKKSNEAHYLEQNTTGKEVAALKKEVCENQQNIKDLRKENQKMQYQWLQSTTEGHYQATEKKVEALKKADHELRLMLGRFPIDFHVNYAIKEDQVFPSFYTHSHGYLILMCIEVDANWYYGDGEGTHVSIFMCLMQGPYDDHLKWPFRRVITIQIVNQAGYHSHFYENIYYKDETLDSSAGRVTDKERSRSFGFSKFLPHTDLEYNAAKKTQYLKGNIIIVRVVRVKITQ